MQIGKSYATYVAAVAMVSVATLAHAQPQRPASAQPNPAAEHLAAARAALNKALNSPAPSGDAFKKLSELKTAYLAMEKAASTASPGWGTHYKTIDQLLTDLVGPAPASKEAGAVGTSGGSGMQLDAALTANLLDFRTHVTAFSGAMAAVAPAAGTAPPAASPAPAPVTAGSPPPATADPAATAPPPAAASAAGEDATTLAQLDSVVGMIDAVLKSNTAQTATVPIDRAMLEQMKSQLEQVRAKARKP